MGTDATAAGQTAASIPRQRASWWVWILHFTDKLRIYYENKDEYKKNGSGIDDRQHLLRMCRFIGRFDRTATSDKFFKTIVDFNSYISGAYTPLVKLYGEDAPYVACAGAEDVCTPVVRWKGFEQVNINTVGNPDEVTMSYGTHITQVLARAIH